MNKLTDKQIKNWRKFLSTKIGPDAYLMDKEQIQEYYEKYQSNKDKEVKKRKSTYVMSSPIKSERSLKTKICPFCKSEIPKDASFCRYCAKQQSTIGRLILAIALFIGFMLFMSLLIQIAESSAPSY